ncbi:ATP-grasp domain-containing protein [Nonomuraea sp. NPDC004354]
MVYDQGAVGPAGILRVAEVRPVVIVLAPSDHAQRMRPLFNESCAAVYGLNDMGLVQSLLRHDVTGVVTFSEPMLRSTSELATALSLPSHDATVVERLTRKDMQRRALRAAGVDATATVTIRSVHEWEAAVRRVGLPAVAKPIMGVSSRNTVLIEDLEAGCALLPRLLRDEGGLVVEEYLRGAAVPEPFGDYVSVETVVHRGACCHFAVTGKLRLAPPFRECGQFWPARLDPAARESVLKLADNAVKALDVRSGILHTEMKLTSDGPRIIEVNGRVGGWIPELAREAARIDLADIAIGIARNERIEMSPLDLDRVFFQFTTPAPVEFGIVTAITGMLNDVPGVTRYTPLVRPGAVVGGVHTYDLDLVAGEAPDHESLAEIVESLMDRISYQFQVAGRRIDRTARDLVYTDGGK